MSVVYVDLNIPSHYWRGKGNGALEALVAGLPIPVEIIRLAMHQMGKRSAQAAGRRRESRLAGVD